MAKEKLTYQGTKPAQEDLSDTAHALPTAGNSPGDKADDKTDKHTTNHIFPFFLYF